jgi:CRISPR/Cas system-associated exonuclease Cas4 (RecB family)
MSWLDELDQSISIAMGETPAGDQNLTPDQQAALVGPQAQQAAVAEVIPLPTLPRAAKLPTSYLSPSQINMFRRCGLSYYFRYCLGMKIPPNFNLTWGSSIHATAEHNYKHKLKKFADLPLKDCQEFFAAEWGRQVKTTEFGKDDPSPGELLDAGVKATAVYYQDIATKVQPVMCEQEFMIKLAGVPVKGVIDLIARPASDPEHGPRKLRDTKTTGKSPSKDKETGEYEVSADYALQLAIYQIGYFSMFHELPEGAQFDYVIRTKEPKTLEVPVNITDKDILWTEKSVDRMIQSIESGIFYPNPNHFLCSPKFCGYWNMCKEGRW